MMLSTQKGLLEIVSGFSEEKLLKEISYVLFLKNEEDNELLFSAEEEAEFLEEIRNSPRLNADDVEKGFT